MSRFLAIVSTAAAAAFWTASAHADEKPAQDGSDPAAMFAQLDSNKDGFLTKEEVPEDKQRLFARLLRSADKNGDGKLTTEEFAAGLPRRERPASGDDSAAAENAAALFQRLDANSDGKVTLDELPEERRERFKRLIERGDKNGDGALSEQELVDAFRARAALGAKPPEAPEKKPGDGPQRPPFGGRFPGFGAGGRPGFGGPFAALDTDHDGKLSAAEISAAPEVIRKLDKNGDGNVTLDELMPPRPEKDPGK